MTMQERHAPGAIAPWKRAHDQIVALTELFEERSQLREVVAVVGIAHNDERATRGGNA